MTILDHHKTALEALSDDAATGNNVTKIIDMNRSGATIAFDFFRDKLLRATTSDIKFVPDSKLEKVEKLFKFIEDGDLWRWKLLHSKAFSSGLKDMNLEFNVNINQLLFNQVKCSALLPFYWFIIICYFFFFPKLINALFGSYWS